MISSLFLSVASCVQHLGEMFVLIVLEKWVYLIIIAKYRLLFVSMSINIFKIRKHNFYVKILKIYFKYKGFILTQRFYTLMVSWARRFYSWTKPEWLCKILTFSSKFVFNNIKWFSSHKFAFLSKNVSFKTIALCLVI